MSGHKRPTSYSKKLVLKNKRFKPNVTTTIRSLCTQEDDWTTFLKMFRETHRISHIPKWIETSQLQCTKERLPVLYQKLGMLLRYNIPEMIPCILLGFASVAVDKSLESLFRATSIMLYVINATNREHVLERMLNLKEPILYAELVDRCGDTCLEHLLRLGFKVIDQQLLKLFHDEKWNLFLLMLPYITDIEDMQWYAFLTYEFSMCVSPEMELEDLEKKIRPWWNAVYRLLETIQRLKPDKWRENAKVWGMLMSRECNYRFMDLWASLPHQLDEKKPDVVPQLTRETIQERRRLLLKEMNKSLVDVTDMPKVLIDLVIKSVF